MAKKKFFLGVLVITLVFGILVVGCNDGSSSSGSNSNSNNSSSISGPTGLTASSLSPSRIKLNWNYVSGASTYIVFRESDTGFNIVKSGLSETNFIDIDLNKDTTYKYKVAGQNGNIIGTHSEIVSVKTGDGVLKSDMTPQEMLECSSGSMSITWEQWQLLQSIVNWIKVEGTDLSSNASFTIYAYENNIEVYGFWAGTPHQMGGTVGAAFGRWKYFKQ